MAWGACGEVWMQKRTLSIGKGKSQECRGRMRVFVRFGGQASCGLRLGGPLDTYGSSYPGGVATDA